MSKCGGCGRFLALSDAAKCGKCSAMYHRACVNIQAKDNVTSDWCCPECKPRTVTRGRNDETPIRVAPSEAKRDKVRGATSGSKVESAPVGNAGVLGGTSGSSEFHMLMEEIREMRSDFKTFRQLMETEMAAIRVSVQACSSRIDSLETRLLAVEEIRSAPGPETAGSFDSIIDGLRRELNERDQELLVNDLEVSNIPETSGENPVHLVKAIGTKLGVVVDDRDIVSAERVGRRQLVATDPAGASERRPRVLVVRLARRDLRDQLLRGARVRRTVTTQDLGVGGAPRRFYLNERLTQANRLLFRKTREAAGAAGWKFIWTRRGQVLACRRPGEQSHRIRTETDLRIFKQTNSA